MITNASYSTIRGKIFDLAIRKKAKNYFEELEKASIEPEKYTEIGLRKILEYAKDTEYGKKYKFSEILTAKNDKELYKKYSEHVPIINYEDIKDYIIRASKGEENLLLPEKPKMYFKTSGTTGKQKLLPASSHHLDSVVFMLNMMISSYAHKKRDIFNARILGITDPPPSDHVEDGTLLGSVSGYNRANMSDFAKTIYSVPEEVYLVPDYTARYYLIMRYSIELEIGLIVTANPSTIVELINNSELYYDDYCNDIENGTISNKFTIPKEIKHALEERLKPNPKRAKFLRELKAKCNGSVPFPKDYWPNLKALLTWKCGNCSFYSRNFYKWIPSDTCHLEFGYFSSECRFGIVVDDDDGTILFPQYAYVEFVAEDDFGDDNPKTFRAFELEDSKKYVPIVSTLSGLYRYNMNDLVVTSKKYNNMPRIKFFQKINGIVSLTGEKLSEKQFMEAVDYVCEELNIIVNFYSAFGNLKNSNYDFYFEFDNKNLSLKEQDKFIKSLDKRLCETNIEYSAKRNSLRLKEPTLHKLPNNSLELIKEEVIKQGGSDGQFKQCLISQNDERKQMFDSIANID